MRPQGGRRGDPPPGSRVPPPPGAHEQRPRRVHADLALHVGASWLPGRPLGHQQQLRPVSPSNFPPYLPSPHTPLPLLLRPSTPAPGPVPSPMTPSPPRPHAGRRRPRSRSSPSGRPRRCRPCPPPRSRRRLLRAQHAVVASLAFYSRSGAVVFAKHGRSVRVTITDGSRSNQERRCPHLRTSSTQRRQRSRPWLRAG